MYTAEFKDIIQDKQNEIYMISKFTHVTDADIEGQARSPSDFPLPQ